jgi:uncharacterized membrane protein HdeD (DUF308 family)
MRLSNLWRRTPGHAPAVTALAVVVAALGVLAALTPLGHAEEPVSRAGVLLALGGGLELLHGIRRADAGAWRRAVTSGLISMLMGLMVFSAPYLAGRALPLLLAVTFAADGVSSIAAARRSAGRQRTLAWLSAAGDVAAAGGLVALGRISQTWLVAVAAALRLFGIAWTMVVTPVRTAEDAAGTVIDDLGLGDQAQAGGLLQEIATEERARASADRGWVVAFLITLFAIHVARLEPDGTWVGRAAPVIALLGDMALAILFGFLFAAPVALSLRGSTRWLERRVWRWYLSPGQDRGRPRHRLAAVWLRYRLRMALRLREARYSITAALWRGLAAGLPVAAVVAATVPVWGMSWFFDTENWASGIWNSFAEARADRWREAMVRAVAGPAGPAAEDTFAVSPPGTAAGDFSFIVIGDPGEGDASQHALRDQLLAVAARPEVRFVVIGSDVVYPDGAMIDYERCFWLPFKGVTKPVFAIPGNHDWYDALEAFLATFLEADAARAAMRARANADLRVTSTTGARIEGLIAQAGRLRAEYGVPTGFQRGPFFELQSERFALLAIDTGIVKRIDDEQWGWLESALRRARGKLIMAVLGHPFYAKAYDMTYGNEPFARLKRLLLDNGATILMAGDTHDLEYYLEPPDGKAPAAHYFVNGGGGAYLSLGSMLQWPAQPPTDEWAFYPSRQAIVGKIELLTPWWKRPAWWWTDRYQAWPFSAEYLSALFDYNVAPFFQSFFEVRVEASAGRARLWPYGVNGRLRWRDLSHSAVLRAKTGDDDFVEWAVPMPTGAASR